MITCYNICFDVLVLMIWCILVLVVCLRRLVLVVCLWRWFVISLVYCDLLRCYSFVGLLVFCCLLLLFGWVFAFSVTCFDLVVCLLVTLRVTSLLCFC